MSKSRIGCLGPATDPTLLGGGGGLLANRLRALNLFLAIVAGVNVVLYPKHKSWLWYQEIGNSGNDKSDPVPQR